VFLPFNTCWDRVGRAEIHRKSLTEIWEGLDPHDVYASEGKIRDDGTGELFLVPVKRDWLLPFSLEFGEVLYHLRAALDSCIYDAAILKLGKNPPPDEEKWNFPICADAGKFQESVRRMRHLPSDIRALLESVQPYSGATGRHEGQEWDLGTTLAILNDWARIDRHRHLHLVGSAITDGYLTIGIPDGTQMTIEHCDFIGGDVLEHQSQIARFKISNWVSGAKIHVQPHFTIEIAVNETPRCRLAEISIAMSLSVEVVRAAFERHFNIVR